MAWRRGFLGCVPFGAELRRYCLGTGLGSGVPPCCSVSVPAEQHWLSSTGTWGKLYIYVYLIAACCIYISSLQFGA